jgi:hypothetical protein
MLEEPQEQPDLGQWSPSDISRRTPRWKRRLLKKWRKVTFGSLIGLLIILGGGYWLQGASGFVAPVMGMFIIAAGVCVILGIFRSATMN